MRRYCMVDRLDSQRWTRQRYIAAKPTKIGNELHNSGKRSKHVLFLLQSAAVVGVEGAMTKEGPEGLPLN